MPILSLHYRLSQDRAFDTDYYAGTHLPLVERIWGPYLARVTALKAVASLDPQASAEFALITLLEFHSDAALHAALAHPDAALLQADIAHFSPVAPTLQINGVLHG